MAGLEPDALGTVAVAPVREREVEIKQSAASLPAGAASGVADRDNPLRIDSFALIAARLDGEARAIFEEAVQLLEGLRSGRDHVEAKMREAGRSDPIRTVTGASALDVAIERTQAMIRVLGQMRH